MNIFEYERNRGITPRVPVFEDGWPDQLSPLPLPALGVDSMPTEVNLRRVSKSSFNEHYFPADTAIDEMITWIIPAVPAQSQKGVVGRFADVLRARDGYVASLRTFIKSAGLYALASVALPLISLLLTPFLTRNLSAPDYGILTILTTFIGLIVGISQLGLSSAFFRAYGYDYTDPRDKRAVLSTVTMMLLLSSLIVGIGMILFAPLLAQGLFGRSSLSDLIRLTAWVVLLQNLTVPGYAWMRAESRALSYSCLSITSLLVTLVTTLLFVGRLHWGVAGALLATASGYAAVLMCTVPVIIIHTGLQVRLDIARNMVTFGVPLVLNFVSYWILQLSDRYLLTLLGSLDQTAKYAVVYTLGSAISVVVIGPFTLAWPSAMFAIAKRADARRAYQLFFRWFSLFLLLSAFGLSLVGALVLNWLFPSAYHPSAPIIPIVALSIAFYGVYYVFMVGANITRKTWIAPALTTFVAVINVAFNLVLIPHYGAMGAALSTLLAYTVLIVAAYILNQKIYFIPFEVHTFYIAVLIGVVCYMASDSLAHLQTQYIGWSMRIAAFCLYAIILILLGRFGSLRLRMR